MTKWIESGGGPLMILPRRALTLWGGFEEGGASDYDRACSVTEEIESLSVGAFQALVLGDVPHRTTWCAFPDDGGLVIRWVHADDESSILAWVRGSASLESLPATPLPFRTPGECVMFDSACPGADVEDEEHLVLPLRAGVYAVYSGMIDLSSEVRLMVHRLVARASLV